MQNLARWILSLALLLAVAIPSSAWAQGRGNANGHDKPKKHDQRRVIVLDDDDRRDRDRRDRDDDDWDDVRRDRDDDWDDRDDDWDDDVRDRDRRDRDDRGRIILRDGGRVIILDDDDYSRYAVRNGRGPSFCRSGAGHPVFGLRWCLEKGFGIGRPGSVFLREGGVFLRDQGRVIYLPERPRDTDRAFWNAVIGQVLAWAD